MASLRLRWARGLLPLLTVALLAATSPAQGAEAPSSGAAARRDRLAAFLAEHVDGGSYGFLLVDLKGRALASWRDRESFYPASSLKVLYLLEAMRWAAAQGDLAAALATRVAVRTDPCGGGEARWERLDTVLGDMMRRSDNLRANAVGDFFGLEAIDLAGHEQGGTSPQTVVAHRFGCGGPANDPANATTAADLAGVFRRYGQGTLLPQAAADRFASYFLSAETGVLDEVVFEESAALGQAGIAPWFLSRVGLIYKAGWWGTDLSVAGYAGLPRRVCGVVQERGLAFAVFVSDAASVASGFTVDEMLGEILREEIRASLSTVAFPACRALWAPHPG